MSRILALIDHSIYARSVGACAAWLSAQTGAEVELLHVVDKRPATANTLAWSGAMAVSHGPGMVWQASHIAQEGLGPALARGADLLEETRDLMLASGATSVQPRLVRGHLEEIVEQAQSEAHLIVLGKRGEGADLARLPLGSNLTHFTRSLRKPMVLAARAFRAPARWLLAFASDPELKTAITQITSDKLLPPLPCEIVHAGSTDPAILADMNETVAMLSHAGIEARLHIAEGDPDHVLPRHMIAADMDMIALGGLRRSALRTAISGGGTAETLIRACQVPALLLR